MGTAESETDQSERVLIDIDMETREEVTVSVENNKKIEEEKVANAEKHEVLLNLGTSDQISSTADMIDIKIEPPIKKIDDTIADSMHDDAPLTETFSDPVTINESMNDPVISLDVDANLKEEVIDLKEETDDTKQECTFLTEIKESVEETNKELSISEFVADIEHNDEVQIENVIEIEPAENISQDKEEAIEKQFQDIPVSDSVGVIEETAIIVDDQHIGQVESVIESTNVVDEQVDEQCKEELEIVYETKEEQLNIPKRIIPDLDVPVEEIKSTEKEAVITEAAVSKEEIFTPDEPLPNDTKNTCDSISFIDLITYVMFMAVLLLFNRN